MAKSIQIKDGDVNVYAQPKPWELLHNVDLTDETLHSYAVDKNKYTEIAVEVGMSNGTQAYGGTVVVYPWGVSGIGCPNYVRWNQNGTIAETQSTYIMPNWGGGEVIAQRKVYTLSHKVKIWAR